MGLRHGRHSDLRKFDHCGRHQIFGQHRLCHKSRDHLDADNLTTFLIATFTTTLSLHWFAKIKPLHFYAL